MKRIATLILIAAGCAWTQAPDPLDVRGVVLEPNTNLPVAGAQVTLYEFVEDETRLVIRKVYATTSTDARGAFQFHAARFGDYFVDAKKNGYLYQLFGGPGDINSEAAETTLSLSASQTPREIKFYLWRPGELTGRVIDEDGKPVAGLRVWATTSVNLDALQQHSAITDASGAFTIAKLTPDRYLLRTSPKAGDFEIVMPSFTEADLKVVDQDYETSSWPTPVSPGASTSVGTITVRKTSYYRAHVTVLGEECGPKEGWQFSAVTATSLPRYSVVLCAKEFLVRNLKPGSYWFNVTNMQDGEKNRQGLAPVEVRSENVEVKLTTAPGATVSVQLVAIEGGTLPALQRIAVLAAPSIQGLFNGPATPVSEGKFLIKNMAATPYRIGVLGLTGKYYAKEFRYNGIPAPDGMITPSPDGRLEIVIDDQGAMVTGSVIDGDKPANRPRVVLLDNRRSVVGNALGDQEGKFQITGLAPGEYRILAFPESYATFPDNIARFLDSAEKVTLERGGVQNFSLKLSDPTR
jgi:hypothetical protein